MKLVIVDYKVGNIGSVLNMFKKIGVKALLASNAEDIEMADKLLLPGVGSFDAGISQLHSSGLLPAIQKKVIEEKTPILGICLGMQLLLENSEEGKLSGLGWIQGQVKKFTFPEHEKLRVPHMGWNFIKPANYDSLFYGFEDEARFYFAHSYYAECSNVSNISATTGYGFTFTSAVQKDNIFGVQFHPEKSHRFGLQVLKNFVERT